MDVNREEEGIGSEEADFEEAESNSINKKKKKG